VQKVRTYFQNNQCKKSGGMAQPVEHLLGKSSKKERKKKKKDEQEDSDICI
jgi:hypothetical protein